MRVHYDQDADLNLVKGNKTSFKATRAKAAVHRSEEIGAKLRGMMPWIGANKLVDRDRS